NLTISNARRTDRDEGETFHPRSCRERIAIGVLRGAGENASVTVDDLFLPLSGMLRLFLGRALAGRGGQAGPRGREGGLLHADPPDPAGELRGVAPTGKRERRLHDGAVREAARRGLLREAGHRGEPSGAEPPRADDHAARREDGDADGEAAAGREG